MIPLNSVSEILTQVRRTLTRAKVEAVRVLREEGYEQLDRTVSIRSQSSG